MATHYLVLDPCTASQVTRAITGPRAYEDAVDAALNHLEASRGYTAKIQAHGMTVWDSEHVIERSMTSLEWSEILTMVQDHSDAHNPESHRLRCLILRLRTRAIAASEGRCMV